METIIEYKNPHIHLRSIQKRNRMDDEKQLTQFKNQIAEDISIIQGRKKGFKKAEYTFNYWILDNIYNVDEDMIPNQITDRNDKAIDCYVHYPDSKILYIIQNKYYDELTIVKREELNDFLNAPLDHLNAGNYKNKDLQTLFNSIKTDKEYKFYLHFYVTNSKHTYDQKTAIDGFNANPKYKLGEFIKAEYFRLGDLYDKYYGIEYKNQVNYSYTLQTKHAKNILNVLPEEYKLPEMSRAHYMLTPVWQIWEMLKEAKAKKYALFEENIREYLGDNDINGGIINTLKDKKERNNFFYYNNGVTIIVEKIDNKNGSNTLTITKPQIVNGCQTVNSIYECLNIYGDAQAIQLEFKDVFVMTKILLFDKTIRDKKGEHFYDDIVRYNNKQNPINDKAFASKKPFFKTLQSVIKDRGFLLLVQPSDKHKAKITESNTIEKLISEANEYAGKVGLVLNKKDIQIPLEKLLQVYIAFVKNGFYAFTKKSSLLKEQNELYQDYTLKINELNTHTLILLWLLYWRAEKDKERSEDQTSPIPYYVIGFLGYIIKNKEKRNEAILELFNKNLLEKIYSNFLSKLTIEYKIEFLNAVDDNSREYNNMIKTDIDTKILDRLISQFKRNYLDKELTVFIDKYSN